MQKIKNLKTYLNFSVKTFLLTSLYLLILTPLLENLQKLSVSFLINPIFHVLRSITPGVYFIGISVTIATKLTNFYAKSNKILMFPILFFGAFLCFENLRISLIFSLFNFLSFCTTQKFFIVKKAGIFQFLNLNTKILYSEILYNKYYYTAVFIILKLGVKLTFFDIYELLIFSFGVFVFEKILIFNLSFVVKSKKLKEFSNKEILTEENVLEALNVIKSKLEFLFNQKLDFYIFNSEKTTKIKLGELKNSKNVNLIPFYEFLFEKILKIVLIKFYQRNLVEILKIVKLKIFFSEFEGNLKEISHLVYEIEKVSGREMFDKELLNCY